MRNVKCNLCGSNEYIPIDTHRKDKYCNPEIEVRTVICKNCGLVYVNPQPEEAELRNLYSTTYAGVRSDLPSEKRLLQLERMADGRLRWIDERVGVSDRTGKIMDVGGGVGSLLNAFKKRGWDAYGIEPTTHYAEFARERYRLKMTTGFLEDGNLPNSYFDMVTLTQTLEHLPDPTQALITLRKSLKDGGIIYIDVPNILKPKHFRFFEAPHVYTFSPATLSLLLRKTGFELIYIENGWDVRAVAKRSNMKGNIDFSAEGDDYKEIISNLKWRYILLAGRKIKIKLLGIPIGAVSSGITYVFGEQKGREIKERIKKFKRKLT